ncbi:hypothetical protein [Mucilaginibacter myungsuensis]
MFKFNKILYCLTSIVLLWGCSGERKSSVADSTNIVSQDSSTKTPAQAGAALVPYKLNEDYTVIDTGAYGDDGPMAGGTYAIITKNKILVDTIDLSFGMKKIKDGAYLYQTVKSWPPDPEIDQDKNSIWGSTAEYCIIENGRKTLLEKLAPNLDNYFSSPNVIGNKIYYWQLAKVDTVGGLKLSAGQLDLTDRKTTNHYLFDDILETDDAGYFCAPYAKNDTIFFVQDNKIKKFSKDFKPYF